MIIHETLEDTGGVRWPIVGLIQLRLDGLPAGFVDFMLSPREGKALIRMIEVVPARRRSRLATTLMDELLRRHPSVRRLVLPELLPDGRRFFRWYRHERKLG